MRNAMEYTWSLLDELQERYGSSYYIMEYNALRDNYFGLLTAFRNMYRNTNVAYSYKANYTPFICSFVNDNGGYAEVASGMEYDLAIKIGVEPSRILHNGPYKPEQDIRRTLINRSILIIDSPGEAVVVKKILGETGQGDATLGIRCNFDSQSRFGFDIESGDLIDALRLLQEGNCPVRGLHCHCSTISRDVEAFRARTRALADLSDSVRGLTDLRFIDAGGGFFGIMPEHFARQFNCHVPGFDEYAGAVAAVLKEKYPRGDGPELIIEPGVAIAGNTMRFITKVDHLKKIKSRKIATVAGTVFNIKPTLHGKNMPMTIMGKEGVRETVGESPVDVAGSTCMDNDYLYRNCRRDIHEGDFLIFDNVGSYTTVLKPPFIVPNVPIITRDPDSGGYYELKRQETFDDIFGSYCFK
jgi:diaminopimelate decarboxylase